jgi:hypothetical protein
MVLTLNGNFSLVELGLGDWRVGRASPIRAAQAPPNFPPALTPGGMVLNLCYVQALQPFIQPIKFRRLVMVQADDAQIKYHYEAIFVQRFPAENRHPAHD